MDEMKELIDERLVERVILLLGVAGPVVGLVGGAGYSAWRRQSLRGGLLRGLLVGLAGPLLLGLWRLYSWLVRYQPAADPKDDYFGLERVDVLLLNVAIFVTVGALVGWMVRLVRERDRVAAAVGNKLPAGSGNDPATP